MLKYSLIFLLYLIYFVSCQDNDHCQIDTSRSTITCNRFDSFSQLDFSQLANQSFRFVTLEPSTKLHLDSLLNLNGLVLNSSDGTNVAKLRLKNINGLDPFFDGFRQIAFTHESYFDVEFDDIFFEFSRDEEKLDEAKCVALIENELNGAIGQQLIFSDLKLRTLTIRNVIFEPFESPICPLVFKKTSIDSFVIDSPANKLRYVEIVNELSSIVAHLNVTINELLVTNGLKTFIFELNERSLLNEIIFGQLRGLKFRRTSINSINGNLFAKFKHLKELSLVDVDTRALLMRGADWLAQLNGDTVFDWSMNNETGSSNDSLTTELKPADLFYLTFGFDPRNDVFKFDESDICLFEKFAHRKLIVPLIETANPNDMKQLPCSCTISWLFKYFRQYRPLLSEDILRAKIPGHCVEIADELVDEQIEYCSLIDPIQSDAQIIENKCNKAPTTVEMALSSTTTSPIVDCLPFDKVDPQWGKYCSCSFGTDINFLQCSDPMIQETPSDFRAPNNRRWSFVSFVGSSIKSISKSSFNNLQLAENATIQFDNLDEIDSDLFSGRISYTNKFRFLLRDSDLNGLFNKYPFTNVNLSQLELTNCLIDDVVLSTRLFSGATIDLFSINKPHKDSYPLLFRHTPVAQKISIRKFKIQDAFETYRSKNPFSLNNIVLNYFVFADLEELEIVNTFIDYIDSNALFELNNLKVVRLENVHLKSIVKSYLSDGPVDFNDPSVNWLANDGLDEIFVGREHLNEIGFKFENEFLCYFAGLSSKTKFYVYDSIDFNDGIECTCTLLWIYSLYNESSLESLLSQSPNSMYITKCIRQLGTRENVEIELKKCLAENEIRPPLEHCKAIDQTTTTQDRESTNTDSIASITTTTTEKVDTSPSATSDSFITNATTTTTNSTTTNSTTPSTTRNATITTTRRTISNGTLTNATTTAKANEQNSLLEKKIENLTKLFLGLGISFGSALLITLLLLFIYFHRRFKSLKRDYGGLKYDRNIQMNSMHRNKNY